jgi:4-hydroxyphenylpyruvate dioxygenase
MTNNYLNLRGIEFTEFSSENPTALHNLFLAFGFSRLMRHKTKKIDLYQQNDIVFLLNYEPATFGTDFYKKHGPCVSAMGWRVDNAINAHATALERGATDATQKADYTYVESKIMPAIYGIGESLIYLVDTKVNGDRYELMGFEKLQNPDIVADLGFMVIDHLTNNVEKGTMAKWSNFYKDIFGFTEVRYFDIRGVKTGLTSYALRSPDGSFCIPINEGTDNKSQINEYLEEYKGPGVQHIALLTNDMISSTAGLQKAGISTLDMDDQYYQEVFERVPNVTEDHKRLQELQILIDGDDEGYLLQIFTKNVIGPIFFELIQRKNHLSFGEGNFGALFRSIERDQQKRGYLD